VGKEQRLSELIEKSIVLMPNVTYAEKKERRVSEWIELPYSKYIVAYFYTPSFVTIKTPIRTVYFYNKYVYLYDTAISTQN